LLDPIVDPRIVIGVDDAEALQRALQGEFLIAGDQRTFHIHLERFAVVRAWLPHDMLRRPLTVRLLAGGLAMPRRNW
jgi:hypothetical protein